MLEAPVGKVQRLLESILDRTRVSEQELQHPRLLTVPKVVLQAILPLLVHPAGFLIASTFILLIAWGFQGELGVLRGIDGLKSLGLPLFWEGWGGAGSDPATRDRIIEGLAWDQELISFAGGFVLLVVLPAIFIRVVLRQSLGDYGLGLPPKGRRRFAIVSALGLAAISLPGFFFAAADADIQAEYPVFRGVFESDLDFAAYEVMSLMFFVVIEFVFRGYLLFGLYKLKDSDVSPPETGVPGPLLFGYMAVLIAMLSYTAWHLGKPQLELWGTIPFGFIAGSVALTSRSILPLIVIHWLLNVFLDVCLRNGWSLSSLF